MRWLPLATLFASSACRSPVADPGEARLTAPSAAPAKPSPRGARPGPPASTTATATASPVTDPRAVPPKPRDDALALDARGDRAFALRLYQALHAEPGGNLFFSPASVRLALCMAYAGARGVTAAEMKASLGLGEPVTSGAVAAYVLGSWNARSAAAAVPHDAPEWERRELESRRETLRVVSRIWGQEGEAFLPEYLSTLENLYAAPMSRENFEADPEGARKAINHWVAERTEQRIPELLGSGVITRLTRLVLTNAVYFKAAWASPFQERSTKEAPFRGASRPAKMMEQTSELRFEKIPGAAVVELPYRSGNVAMVIVLPAARDGLPALERSLTPAKFETLGASLRSTRVHLSLPKFRARSSLLLGDTLRRLGMPQAFDADRADFSGMNGKKDLSLSEVVHQAYVDVDERGTEAAAATAAVMRSAAALRHEAPPEEFRADRPFLFFIRDTVLGHLLFVGKIIDPGVASPESG